MTLRCMLTGHTPSTFITWNEGYYFSTCTRCGHDVIRQEGPWRRVPHGYRVVWATGYRRHAVPSDFGRRLPMIGGKRRRRPAQSALQSVGSVVLSEKRPVRERPAPADDAPRPLWLMRLLLLA
ncbi:hypothetical protein KY084_11975 [Stakelama sp. CBK3Z-3]|uniref:Ig-like domain-containing protein n=1 Tax=Stakelama flava TaxID=2860338 RepID=A0ABS6XN20_9SPHN|nr:hypothetical protein [Stakelama flava]MBW4331586.1 hypothetical protein [Stakelama flava]